MFFGSKFAFKGNEEDNVEEIDEEDLRTGWDQSNPVEVEAAAASLTATPDLMRDNVSEVMGRRDRLEELAELTDGLHFEAVRARQPSFLERMRTSLFSSSSSASSAAPASAASAPAAAASAPAAAGSSEGASAIPPAPRLPSAAQPLRMRFKEKTARQATRRQEVNTNIVAIKLASLADTVAIHTGDAEFCGQCRSVFSAVSKTEGPHWTCEFCGHKNEVDLQPEERPATDSVDYVLKPAPAAVLQDESVIVFCLDVSGSMCTTTEVAGRLNLRNDRLASLRRSLAGFTEGSQRLPGGSSNVTYISRLQAMQGAVTSQIESMSTRHPHRRVGFVTFGNDVQLLGDCASLPVIISGDHLNDKAYVQEKGQSASLLTAPVGERSRNLTETLNALEEGGRTALGPALLASVAMASKQPGSRVVVCTDGMANVGLGALDLTTEEEQVASRRFYQEVADFAQSKGVAVSILTVEGQECRLEELSAVVERTGGDVERVNPLNMNENFHALLADPVLATKVSVTMLLHHGLRFKSDVEVAAATATASASAAAASAGADAAAVIQSVAKQTQEFGTVDASSEVVYEYCIGKSVSVAEVPFQVQIRFTKPNGMECLRVLTKLQPVTSKKEDAEAELDVQLCLTNAAQKSARLAQQCDYEEARSNAYAWRQKIGRHVATKPEAMSEKSTSAYARFQESMQTFDSSIQGAMQSEVEEGVHLDEASSEMRQARRKGKQSDAQVHACLNAKKAGKKFFS